MSPDPRYVSDFLEAVARECGGADADFSDHVRERLDHGEREYGDSYRERPLRQILSEVREEMADVPAWCVLAIERSYAAEDEGKLLREEAQFLRVCLVSWAARQQGMWRELTTFLSERPTF